MAKFCLFVNFTSNMSYFFQLKKKYPELHFKLPGKRILGNNFDPGKFDRDWATTVLEKW